MREDILVYIKMAVAAIAVYFLPNKASIVLIAMYLILDGYWRNLDQRRNSIVHNWIKGMRFFSKDDLDRPKMVLRITAQAMYDEYGYEKALKFFKGSEFAFTGEYT